MTALATDADTQTALHRMPKTAPVTYTGVTWRLFARKELFFAGDYIKNEEMTKFIFKQVGEVSGLSELTSREKVFYSFFLSMPYDDKLFTR